MSRRDAGGARQDGRHARDRLQSTLGEGGPLLTDGSGKAFVYDGGVQPAPGADGPAAAGGAGVVTGKPGPALRWRTGRRAALLIGALAVLCGAWFWLQVAAGEPQVVPLGEVSPQDRPASDGVAPSAQDAEEADAADPAGGSAPPGIVIIHVAGAVAVPGVVQLPAGSRVHQAVSAAGGGSPGADINRLNLAAVVTDGEKLYVPRTGEQIPAARSAGDGQPAGTGTGGVSPAGDGKISLNTAGVEELDALPRVGPVLAQRIVDWRKEHGPFTSVEELDAVDGVGPKMLETLLPLVGI